MRDLPERRPHHEQLFRLGHLTKPGRRKRAERSGKLSEAHTNNAERSHRRGVLDLIARYDKNRNQHVQKNENLISTTESTTISIYITVAGKEGRRNIQEIEEKLNHIYSTVDKTKQKHS